MREPLITQEFRINKSITFKMNNLSRFNNDHENSQLENELEYTAKQLDFNLLNNVSLKRAHSMQPYFIRKSQSLKRPQTKPFDHILN